MKFLSRVISMVKCFPRHEVDNNAMLLQQFNIKNSLKLFKKRLKKGDVSNDFKNNLVKFKALSLKAFTNHIVTQHR